MPDVVPQVAVVGDADEAAELELVHAGLLLDFAERRHFDVLAGFLMAFGEVPEAAAGDKEKVAATVGNQAAGGIDLLELRTDAAVSLFRVVGGDIDAGKRVLDLEHPDEGMDIHPVPDVEFDGVRIGQGLVIRGADDDTALLEINLVHNICYICRLQR